VRNFVIDGDNIHMLFVGIFKQGHIIVPVEKLKVNLSVSFNFIIPYVSVYCKGFAKKVIIPLNNSEYLCKCTIYLRHIPPYPFI